MTNIVRGNETELVTWSFLVQQVKKGMFFLFKYKVSRSKKTDQGRLLFDFVVNIYQARTSSSWLNPDFISGLDRTMILEIDLVIINYYTMFPLYSFLLSERVRRLFEGEGAKDLEPDKQNNILQTQIVVNS